MAWIAVRIVIVEFILLVLCIRLSSFRSTAYPGHKQLSENIQLQQGNFATKIKKIILLLLQKKTKKQNKETKKQTKTPKPN